MATSPVSMAKSSDIKAGMTEFIVDVIHWHLLRSFEFSQCTITFYETTLIRLRLRNAGKSGSADGTVVFTASALILLV